MKKNYTLNLTFIIVFMFTITDAQTTLVFEDFETAIGNSPSSAYIVRNESAGGNPLISNAVEYNLNRPNLSADYFGRVSLTEINQSNPPTPILINNIQGTRFFGVNDADQTGNPNGTGFDIQSLNWFNLDVSNISSINASAFFAETDGTGETWDASSSVRFEYSTNNSNWTTFFAIESSGANTAPQIDSVPFDGTGDGAIITNTLTQFTSMNVDVSLENTISVRIYFVGLTSNLEDIAIDNFTIAGVNTLSNDTFSNKEFELAAYPNPTTDVLNINTSLEINTIEIYNLLGQNVAKYNSSNISNNSINTTQLSKGVYLVKVFAEDNIKVFKIIKE